METISQKWAKFALGLNYKDIPSVAIKEAKRFLLDSVGCAFSALNNKDTQAAYDYIRDLGGKEQAAIIGWGTKANLPQATLMNSLLIRALDYNDIYWEQDPSHPSDIIPAVISTGEFMKKNGKEVLLGIIIAYELEMRMCLAALKWDKDILTKGLGENFLINQCGYKAFPTEALTHQPITAVLEVMQENNLDPKEVKEILVETTTRGADILSDPSKYKPTTKETADHSLPYCIAVAVAKGNVLPSDFEEGALRDPFVWSLLEKIKVVANPEIDNLFPKVKRAIITIKTSKGEYKKQEDFAKGQPERPLSEEELISKFKANSEKKISPSRMEDIIKATKELENVDEIGEYMKLLVSNK